MSGGLAGDEPSIAREGRLMLEALAVDAAHRSGLDVTVLVDARAELDLPPAVRTVEVPPGDDTRTLVAAARDADWTLVVAPESDGILTRLVQAVREAGCRALACDDRFIEVAADKQATIDALAAAGVPVPAGRVLAARESWPLAFARPAVRKARFGVGCEGLAIVGLGAAAPAPSTTPTRIESFAAGTPAGISCICGPRGVHPLPAMRQVFSTNDPAAYAGGEPLAEPAIDLRAQALAIRAVAAVARAAGGTAMGWVGVDLILGRRADGRDDRVLEVNPRLTTSFVGHARGLNAGLVRAMLDAAAGIPPRLPRTPLPFRVTADAESAPSA